MVEFSVLKKTRFSDLIKWNVSELLSNKVLGKYENQPLTKFLIRSKNAIEIKDDVLYKQITIHQFGAGVSLRCEKYGKEIGTKRQFVAKKGQFIISRIDARNGSFGIVPDFLDGAIVTNDFWLFDIKNADADFLRLMLSSNKINSFWQSKSNGTTNRQRVDFDDFIKSSLPIPSLEEQKAIVQKYQECITNAEELKKQAEELNYSIENYIKESLSIPTINDDIKASLLSFGKFSDLSEKWTISPLLSEINEKLRLSKYKLQKVFVLNCVTRSWKKNQHKDKYFNYIEIGGINVDTGKLTSVKVEVSKAPSRATQVVHTGDLIFGMTRPYLKKFAIVDKEHDNCICSSGFQVIGPSKEYNLNFILEVFKSNICISQFKEAMTGALYPALNAEQLKNIRIPLPPLSVQNEIVSHINQIKKQVKDLREQAKILREQAKKEFEESVFE